MHPPPAFRFRRGMARDVPYCLELLPEGTRLDAEIRRQLPELWKRLLATEASTLTIVEDMERGYPDNIEGFGLSVFVTDAFAHGFGAAPQPYLSALLYSRMLAGEQIVLTSEELTAANTTTGINVVVLHFGLRHADLDEPRTAHALAAGSAGFFFFHSGFRINSMTNEVYGEQQRRYMQSGGFRLAKDWREERPADFSEHSPEQYPCLFMLQREWVAAGAVNPLSQLFFSPAPRILFPAIERHILERALLNEPDSEIAANLGLSSETVKKTWASIYQRVGKRAPYLMPPAELSLSGRRGPEKRRHLLGYLRMHLEELRPSLTHFQRLTGMGIRACDHGWSDLRDRPRAALPHGEGEFGIENIDHAFDAGLAES
jgi:hypothetical protein